jgi:predicted methyltransferase
MASQTAPAPTNERILRLLEEVKAQLADSKRRDEQIARDLARVLERK